jgi:hypothetical protein
MPRAMLAAILIALTLWLGCATATGWAMGSIDLLAVGGDDMYISASNPLTINSYGSLISKEYEVSVGGEMVSKVDLQSSSSLTDDIDGEVRSMSSGLHQRVSLPGYFNIDMSNEDNLWYMNPIISSPDLHTEMNIYTSRGERVLEADATPDFDNIDEVIDQAMQRIDQQWYETYCAGNNDGLEGPASKKLEMTIGYMTSFSESGDGVKCDWGHEYSATKGIEFD